VDSAGKPVAGAVVAAVPVQGAYRPSGELATDKVRATLTGQDGKTKLESLPPGPWNVSIHARGFAEQSLKRVASGPLAVRLERGGVVTGVVRDGEAKRPVAGARVEVVGDGSLASTWSHEAARNETVTDAAGHFRLEGIGRSPVRIAARARGFGRAERNDVRPGASVEVFLFPGASLSGVVRDDAGRPVAGAEVRAEGDQSWGAPPPERSDARGEFRLDGVPPGEYTVVAREGARAPGIAVAVVEPGGEATVSLTVSDGGYAVGRIVDAEGRPVAGQVRVESWNGRSLPGFACDSLAANTKADGSFALGPLPVGSLGVAASAPRFATRRVDAELAARGRTVDLGDLALDAGLAIRGRVHDREGNGIAGAEVHAERHGPGSPSEGEAVSEADGGFVVGGLELGSHDLRATALGYAPAEATATSGGDPVDLVLEPGGQMEGRVVDADGSPVEDARVWAENERGRSGSGGVLGGRSDEGDGRFVVRDVAAGRYALQVLAGSRGEAAVTDVRVVAGRTTNVGTITLGRGGTLQGTVVDGEGSGIAGATVVAHLDASRRRETFRSQTESSGAFELRGLPVGSLYVSAFHPAYATAPSVAATVDPEKEPVPVRIVLPRGGTIEGRALYRDGRPFVGGRVDYYLVDPHPVQLLAHDTAAIGADGSFLLDHVPPGRTRVLLYAFTPAQALVYGPSSNVLTTVVEREVEVREGEKVSLDLALHDVVVAGRVTRAGQPEPGVLVSVMTGGGTSVMTWDGSPAARVAPAGPPPMAGISREDGSYELLVFVPGPAEVELNGGGQAYPTRAVEIPDADRFELDLEIGGATVSGIVVDRDGGAPVGGASVGLHKEDGMGGDGESALDGRFSLAVEPGEYRLDARARDRQPVSQPLSVGASGVSDLRIEMERGLEIRGRLLDASGRAAPRYVMTATAPDGGASARESSGADGSFRIGGLAQKPHSVVGGAELAGFAFRAGVTPGGEPLVLALQPAARITVRVVDPAGAPVKDAYPRLETIDGAPVRLFGRSGRCGPTDASGACELACPAGAVAISVRAETGAGGGTVSVGPGATASLTVVLAPKAPQKP
jgi:carboxypeptidase family protein